MSILGAISTSLGLYIYMYYFNWNLCFYPWGHHDSNAAAAQKELLSCILPEQTLGPVKSALLLACKFNSVLLTY